MVLQRDSSAGPAIVSVPLSPAVAELMTLRPPAGGLQPPLPGVPGEAPPGERPPLRRALTRIVELAPR